MFFKCYKQILWRHCLIPIRREADVLDIYNTKLVQCETDFKCLVVAIAICVA